MNWKLPVITAAGVAFGALAGATYAKQGKPEYVLVPAGQANVAPLDPKLGDKGPQFAVISGDPKTGPTAGLLKLGKGASPIHYHSSDYYAVTVEGQTRHWLPGKEADSKASGPGTAWFQPGGSAATAHGDECVSDSCTVFIYMPGKFDLQLPPPPKK